MDTSRTFIVRVTTAPPRVIVEDIREDRRAVVDDLAGIGAQVAAWLGLSAARVGGDEEQAVREGSVSPPT